MIDTNLSLIKTKILTPPRTIQPNEKKINSEKCFGSNW